MVFNQVNSDTELLTETNLPSLGRDCCDYGKTCIKKIPIQEGQTLMNTPTGKLLRNGSVNHTCFFNVSSHE